MQLRVSAAGLDSAPALVAPLLLVSDDGGPSVASVALVDAAQQLVELSDAALVTTPSGVLASDYPGLFFGVGDTFWEASGALPAFQLRICPPGVDPAIDPMSCLVVPQAAPTVTAAFTGAFGAEFPTAPIATEVCNDLTAPPALFLEALGHPCGPVFLSVTLPELLLLDDCDGDSVTRDDGDCADDDPGRSPLLTDLCDGFDVDCSDPEPIGITLNGVETADLGTALSSASDGDVVAMCGTHTLDAVVTTGIVLQGFESTEPTGIEASSGSALEVTGAAEVTVRNLALMGRQGGGGSALRGGGALVVDPGAAVVFENVEFSGNQADEGGGAYIDASSVAFVDCFVTENTGESGGGLLIAGSTVATLDATVIEGNAAAGGGGLEVREAASVTLSGGSQILSNTCTSNGGSGCGFLVSDMGAQAGLLLDLGDTEVANNTGAVSEYGAGGRCWAGEIRGGPGLRFTGNSNVVRGGGLAVTNGCVLTFDGTGLPIEFTFNGAHTGGGLFFDGPQNHQLDQALFMGNAASSGSQSGGALRLSSAVVVASGLVVMSNTSVADGAAAHLDMGSRLELTNSTVADHDVRFAFWLADMGLAPELILSTSAVESNTGGGVWVEAGSLQSNTSDWGVGGTDNTPDVRTTAGEASFGTAADFSCTSTGCP